MFFHLAWLQWRSLLCHVSHFLAKRVSYNNFYDLKYWSGLVIPTHCCRMFCDNRETIGHPVYNLCLQVQGSISQLFSLNGNSKSASLLKVKRNSSNMHYCLVALAPDALINNGSAIPSNPQEGMKGSALTHKVHRARTTNCFHNC